MLQYLHNGTNRVGAPNENFARECMELFTMGTGNYTQDDVVAAARICRVLTTTCRARAMPWSCS